jgi:hypothetical protein
MEKFGNSIEWLNKRIEDAREALADFARGFKIEINNKDVTQEWKARYEGIIEKCEALITAYRRLK